MAGPERRAAVASSPGHTAGQPIARIDCLVRARRQTGRSRSELPGRDKQKSGRLSAIFPRWEKHPLKKQPVCAHVRPLPTRIIGETRVDAPICHTHARPSGDCDHLELRELRVAGLKAFRQDIFFSFPDVRAESPPGDVLSRPFVFLPLPSIPVSSISVSVLPPFVPASFRPSLGS